MTINDLKKLAIVSDIDEKGANGIYDFSLAYVKDYLNLLKVKSQDELLIIEILYTALYDLLGEYE